MARHEPEITDVTLIKEGKEVIVLLLDFGRKITDDEVLPAYKQLGLNHATEPVLHALIEQLPDLTSRFWIVALAGGIKNSIGTFVSHTETSDGGKRIHYSSGSTWPENTKFLAFRRKPSPS